MLIRLPKMLIEPGQSIRKISLIFILLIYIESAKNVKIAMFSIQANAQKLAH